MVIFQDNIFYKLKNVYYILMDKIDSLRRVPEYSFSMYALRTRRDLALEEIAQKIARQIKDAGGLLEDESVSITNTLGTNLMICQDYLIGILKRIYGPRINVKIGDSLNGRFSFNLDDELKNYGIFYQ